jgi:hypothetical protein
MPQDPFAAYRVKSPSVQPSSPEPNTEDDPFAAFRVSAAPAEPSAPPVGQRVSGDSFSDKIYNAAKMLGSTGMGVLKGAGSTAAHIGEMAADAGMLPGVRPNANILGPSELRNPAFTFADEANTAQNTPELVGKGLETAAEILIPSGAGTKAAVEAIPSAARAGAKFQSVMRAAKDIPIDVNAPGEVALRISQLAERGGSMPMAVNKFLRRITDPEKAAMNYDEARDFASNISRLSANEFQRLTPVIQREVSGLRVALNKSVADAAAAAGKGKEYAEAMTEYAKAKKLQDVVDTFIEGAKKAAPWATGTGAAVWLSNHIKSLLPGGG